MSPLFAPPLHADPLLLAFDTPGIKISEQEQQRLTSLLSRYSEQAFSRVPAGRVADADLLLTSAVVSSDWHLSNIVVAYIPAMVALSAEKQQHLSQTAQVSRHYMLSATNIDAVPADSNIKALLAAGRYSSIIDFSTAVATYAGYNTLHRQQIYPGQHVRLASRDPQFSEKLAEKLRHAEDANLRVLHEDKISITLQFIAKSLNTGTGLLEESAEDVAFADWLREALPEFDFKTEVTSSADAALKLTKADAACTINGRKRPNAKHQAFSWPTQLYLGPRLYLSPAQPLADLITAAVQHDQKMSVAKLLAMFPELRLSTVDALVNVLPEQQQELSQHMVVPLGRFDSSMTLLQRQRVDAVWLYPVMFRLSSTDFDIVSDIISLPLADSGEPVPAYLVCNQHKSSLALIEGLNQQLAAAAPQQRLLELYSSGLPEADRHSYQQAYQKLIQQVKANSVKTEY